MPNDIQTAVSQIMLTDYPVVKINQQISEAHKLMQKMALDSVPVVQDDKVVKMVTFNNLEIIRSPYFNTHGHGERESRLMCLELSEVNKEQTLVSAKADEPIAEVLKKMLAHQINSLPVLGESGQLEGMVTTHLILGYLVGEPAEEAKE